MKPRIILPTILLLMGGCASDPLMNNFELPEDTGAQLNNGWNGKLNGGLINLFQSINNTELKHGLNVAGKNAKYRVPAGNAKLGIQINWLKTIVGPIYYAKAEFDVTLEDGEQYTIESMREGNEVTIRLFDSKHAEITPSVISDFSNTIPIFAVVPTSN